jgi:basic amino acid/polyamine antiporter, APA family
VSLINVPTSVPLDAKLDGAESEAQSKVEQAKLVGGLRVTGHTLRVRPGQGGRAISEEARTLNAEAIVMQLRYRNGRPLYGKTLQSVLAERPGRVIVVADPRAAQSPVARS